MNPRTEKLDELPALGIVESIIAEDGIIVSAIEKEKGNITRAVELITERLARGGRLVFIGAGTSGRLGVIEAAECPPTFGTDPDTILGIIAGGRKAVWKSAEGAEDSFKEALKELGRIDLKKKDVLVGIAASGTTPFVESALDYAKKKGSGGILVTCNPVETTVPDVVISLLVGPEVITGSTRMKAGTATKMVLNMLTTASMVKLGKTYGNLMVDVRPGSAKLRDRAKRLVMQITGVGEERADELLHGSKWDVKTAIVMEIKNTDYKNARKLLKEHGGFLRSVIGQARK